MSSNAIMPSIVVITFLKPMRAIEKNMVGRALDLWCVERSLESSNCCLI